MIPLLEKFFKEKESLGCDMGDSSLKFVHIEKGKTSLSLKSVGILETDLLTENNVAVQRTKAYLREHGLSGGKVSVNVEDKTLRIRRMDLPPMPANDMKIAIRWNFRDHLDGPVEKYSITCSEINNIKVEGDARPVVAYGVSNEAIEKIMKLLKLVGLKAASVEPNATALFAAFDQSVGWDDKKYHAIIDIGTMVANFVVVGQGELLFSRPLKDVGCAALTKMIAKEAGVTPEAAAQLLRAHQKQGEAGLAEDLRVQPVVANFLGQAVVEIQRSVDAFCLMFNVEMVDSIYLCGGGSMIPGICEYVTKNLGIATKMFDPFERIDTSEVVGGITNPQLYAVAVGLALPRS